MRSITAINQLKKNQIDFNLNNPVKPKTRKMKKLNSIIILIVLVSVQAAFAQNHDNPSTKSYKEVMFFESESIYPFDETVLQLQTEIEKEGWKLISVNDLQKTMKAAGKEVLPVKVFSLCHPKHSGKILANDDDRIVSCMMPCRISVYQKSNGKTYLSRLNPAPIAKSYGGLIDIVMTESANDIEKIIAPLMLKK